jgi:hypothetical protein
VEFEALPAVVTEYVAKPVVNPENTTKKKSRRYTKRQAQLRSEVKTLLNVKSDKRGRSRGQTLSTVDKESIGEKR